MADGVCGYCGADTGARPYARKRDGIPSVTNITGTVDDGKARSFGWAASLIAATTAVHHGDEWAELGADGCTHDKTGLCPACRYIRSQFDREWRRKADVGNHLHHLAASWAAGEPVDVDPVSAPYMDALEQFWNDCQPEFHHVEQTVLYDKVKAHAYRGTFDFVATLTRNGQRRKGLWDIKTGAYRPVEQTLQLAAYAHANWITDWSTGTEQKAMPMPAVAECGVLLLHDDGTYHLVELPVTGDTHGTFLRLRTVWAWVRDMNRWAKDNPLADNNDTTTEKADAA